MPALHLQLDFFSIEEQMPPFDMPILIQTKTGIWMETECINDSEYGPVLSGFEDYQPLDTVRFWALLPTEEHINSLVALQILRTKGVSSTVDYLTNLQLQKTGYNTSNEGVKNNTNKG